MSGTIIFTVTNDLSYDQRMIRICTSLARNGYAVTLVGRRKPQSVALKKESFDQRRLRCIFQKGKLFYLEYNLRLLAFLLFARMDAVCAVDLDTLLPVCLVGQWRKKKIVFDAHEYFTEVPEVVDRPFIQHVWKQVARYSIPKVTAAYTVSESLAEIFEKQYLVPFEIIRNVPFREEKTKSEAEIAPNRKILLYQGVLNEGRGLEVLIETMSFIDDAELWLAGEGDLSAELRTLCQTLQLEDKVVFLGYQPPAKLAAITAQATLGFNLLENRGLSYYYSLANKFFDYIQQGVPSINMNFPEYRKLNDQYQVSLLIDDLHPETLRVAITRLLHDPAYYRQLKANCHYAARHLHWEKEELKLLEWYDKLFHMENRGS